MMLNEYVLGDICDVKIGRTPPRAEKKWFNHDGNSYKWVSIKDIGNCKKYIYSTSETITREGQEKFNIPIVPKGTIILSFKLTVGRIAITTEDMLTNEAIAHFKLNDETYKYYLFMYLKNYDYKSLGNTSSIGKAINSKIIKDMDIEIPEKSKVIDFNHNVSKIFEHIYVIEKEINNLERVSVDIANKLIIK